MIEWYKIDYCTVHGYLLKENSYVCYKITIKLINDSWMLLSNKLNLYKVLSNDIEEAKKVAAKEIKKQLEELISCHSNMLSILEH